MIKPVCVVQHSFPMETLSSHTGDESNRLGRIEEEWEEDSEEEEVEEENEQEENIKERKGETTHAAGFSLEPEDGSHVWRLRRLIGSDPLCSDESVVQSPQRSAWSAGVGFFGSTMKEVHFYVGQDIIIEEGLDSFAGMIWPGVSSISIPQPRFHLS